MESIDTDPDTSSSTISSTPSPLTIPISTPIPKRIFIVPYRNRVQQKFFFEKYMQFILESDTDYEIYFSHQSDKRSFNRGATRNIGFLVAKEKYPDDYKNINFIFNDVDTIPFHKIFDYQTTQGVVKHYYGFKYTLGGIVVIKGSDFEMINGYPNYWAWGNEDNCIQNRCLKMGLKIDRSQFYPIGSPQILQLFDGISRIISKKDYSKMLSDNGYDGIKTIHQLNYSIDSKSSNINDNVFIVNNPRVYMINIHHFLTAFSPEKEEYFHYDLREPPQKIYNPDWKKRTQNTFVTTDDWKNIPYYPTLEERKQLQQLQKSTRYRPPLSASQIYSPGYAKYIGAKPRATISTNLPLFHSRTHK